MGIRARASFIKVTNSKLIIDIVDKLIRDGYLSSFSTIRNGKQLSIHSKYYNSKPVIADTSLISRPTQRISLGCRKSRLFHKNGYVLLLTKRGLLTRAEALQANIGGSVVRQIW